MQRSAFPGFVSFLFLMITSALSAQDIDSLVRFSDLSFQSDFEKEVISNHASGEQVQMIDYYLASEIGSEGSAERVRAQYRAMLSSFRKQGLEEKNEKKMVKAIYKQTHAKLMIRYEEQASFPDLWSQGEFNCVSGSIIYSLLFNDFDVPYLIQKGNNHVFLVTYPETHTIIIESTDSEDGYTVVGQSDKSRYVDMLSQGKMITSEELSNQGVSKVFLQYAYEENQIDELGLASIQYYNRGIFSLQEKDYNSAHSNIEKAYYLSPDENLEPLLVQCGGMILHMSEYENLDDVRMIYKLSRFKAHGITEDDILGEFARLTQKIYLDRKEFEKYEKAYTILTGGLISKELIDKISLLYYGTLVSDFYGRGELDAASDYMLELYKLDSTSQEIKTLVIETIQQGLFGSQGEDPLEVMAYLDDQKRNYPALFKAPKLRMAELAIRLYIVEFMFDEGDPVAAEQYLKAFEEEFKPGDDLSHLSGGLVSVIETAAYYYYNKGNVRKTREYLDRGLRILPGNRRLLYMKESI